MKRRVMRMTKKILIMMREHKYQVDSQEPSSSSSWVCEGACVCVCGCVFDDRRRKQDKWPSVLLFSLSFSRSLSLSLSPSLSLSHPLFPSLSPSPASNL